MKHPLQTRASGFTLVEIAIVLVIIGLLLGGVLKGQELIDSARIKSGVNDLNSVAVAYHAYVDRFHSLAGDDAGPLGTLASLQSRGGNWASVSEFGNNDGVLSVTQAQVFTAGGEAAAFWQALKAGGFIAGNPGDAGVAALPRNAFNGFIGVGPGVTSAAGVTALSVCLSQVPGKAARAIDIQLDDGLADRGNVLATQATVGANTAPGAAASSYSDDNQYTLCRSL